MVRVLLGLLVLFLGCQEKGDQHELVSKVILPKELQTIIKEKSELQLIDVRTLREFQAGHLINAQLIDYYKPDFKKKLSELDKNKPVAVYCAVGVRSNNTLKMLKSLGFKEAYDLKGGIQAWARAGLPLGR